jgi:hypothetical protein
MLQTAAGTLELMNVLDFGLICPRVIFDIFVYTAGAID